MWNTVCKLSEIDNGWIVEFNHNNISSLGIPTMEHAQNTCMQFSERKDAIDYITSFLNALAPEELEKMDKILSERDKTAEMSSLPVDDKKPPHRSFM